MAAFILLALLTVQTNTLRADGADAVLLLNSGSVVNGELLSVRENAFVIGRTPGASDEVLERRPDANISVVPYDKVQKVLIKGRSYVPLGALLGALTGGVVGFAVAPKDENLKWFEPSKRGPVVGGAMLFGLVVGWILGAAASTDRAELDTYISPEKVPSTAEKIVSVTLTDGRLITFDDPGGIYRANYTGKENVIVGFVDGQLSVIEIEKILSALKSLYSLKPYARHEDEEPEFLKAIEVETTRD